MLWRTYKMHNVRSRRSSNQSLVPLWKSLRKFRSDQHQLLLKARQTSTNYKWAHKARGVYMIWRNIKFYMTQRKSLKNRARLRLYLCQLLLKDHLASTNYGQVHKTRQSIWIRSSEHMIDRLLDDLG